MEHQLIPVNVRLTSYTRAEHGRHEDEIQLMCRGQLKPLSTGGMLRYQEVQTDPDTGKDITSDVMLQMQPGRVVMTRLGEYGTTMVFVKDARFEGAYHTPYGDLAMAMYTLNVQTQVGEESGRVHLEYQIDLQGDFDNVHCVDIAYQKDTRSC